MEIVQQHLRFYNQSIRITEDDANVNVEYSRDAPSGSNQHLERLRYDVSNLGGETACYRPPHYGRFVISKRRMGLQDPGRRSKPDLSYNSGAASYGHG